VTTPTNTTPTNTPTNTAPTNTTTPVPAAAPVEEHWL
jgi:hypothetical protein